MQIRHNEPRLEHPLQRKLKYNRFKFKPSDTVYVSNIENIIFDFKKSLSDLLQYKRVIIGEKKSIKYRYNYLIDIYNKHILEEWPSGKKSGYGVISSANYKPFVLFTDVSGDINSNIYDAQNRANKAPYIKNIIH